MNQLGAIALALAFGTGLLTTILGFVGGRTGSRSLGEISRYMLWATTGLVLLSSALLLHAFVDHDFSVRYVQGRSDSRMPFWYTVSAFWGGQEGSLLFWLMTTSAFASAAAWVNRDRLLRVMPWFHGIIGLFQISFLFVLNFVTPPFKPFAVIDTPVEGAGLNPLLQNPLMTIHPPCLLSGFATFAVPYAFGMAALLAGQTSSEWLKATRKWTLISWLLLGVGNVLGGMWAYRELGWGGYWAWDAVENAALVPWLTATAYLHSVIVQEHRGMLKRWNAVLGALTFLLTLLGTYMTRSGLISSVHTFAESEVGHFFLAILVFFTIFSTAIIVWRWPMLTSDRDLESPLSRETAFLANNWVLLGMAFVVLWGTLFPKMKELAIGEKMTIGPPWFNAWVMPMGLLMFVVMIFGTLLPWRRASLSSLRKSFSVPVIVALIGTPILAAAYYFGRAQALGVTVTGYSAALALLGVAVILANLTTLAIEVAQGARAKRRGGEMSWLMAVGSLFSKHRRRYGGYVVHLGVLFVGLALIGNVVKAEVDATLHVGDTAKVGDYEVRFDRIRVADEVDRVAYNAHLTLLRDGKEVGQLMPARWDYNNYALVTDGMADSMKITSEIYIQSTPLEDVYVALLNFNEQGNTAAFKLVVSPFTWWFWFGGLMLLAGALVCLWPDAQADRLPSLGWRWARRVEVLAASMVVVVPAVMLAGEMRAWAADGDHATAPLIDSGAEIPLTREQSRDAYRAFDLVMTTCSGCAGKTLTLASPSCYPSNQDKRRIREMLASGSSLDQVLATFEAERGPTALAIPLSVSARTTSWAIPMTGFALGLGLIVVLARRWVRSDARSGAAPVPDVPLSADEERELSKLRAELAIEERG
jgi:cytochrome c-type biogenesis protein CcmF